MSKSLIDQLREQLEDVENVWLTIAVITISLAIIAAGTLFGVYLYTRR